MMKTKVACYYDKSPLKDGRLIVDDNMNDSWLEPGDFTVVSDTWDDEREEGMLIVEVDIPERSCRFLKISDGMPPVCYYESNGGQPWYMESAPSNFAPELVCFHCQLYAGCREERRHDRYIRPDRHGILEELPELTSDEAGEYTSHIDRGTGEVIG